MSTSGLNLTCPELTKVMANGVNITAMLVTTDNNAPGLICPYIRKGGKCSKEGRVVKDIDEECVFVQSFNSVGKTA